MLGDLQGLRGQPGRTRPPVDQRRGCRTHGRVRAYDLFGYRRREHCRALLVAGGAAAEVLDGRLRLPALEDVDAAGVDQVGGDGEVEAASCPACPFDDAHAAREVGLTLLGLDGDVSCDDDHWCAPLPESSCAGSSTV